MYVDFPENECPGNGVFGCDGLGCYAFVPFDADDVDLRTFPRVGDAAVHTATLNEGDVLFIPALWFHYIIHHPLNGGGRCFALTFTQQQTWRDGNGPHSPGSADLSAYYDEIARKRKDDPMWAAWTANVRSESKGDDQNDNKNEL